MLLNCLVQVNYSILHILLKAKVFYLMFHFMLQALSIFIFFSKHHPLENDGEKLSKYLMQLSHTFSFSVSLCLLINNGLNKAVSSV